MVKCLRCCTHLVLQASTREGRACAWHCAHAPRQCSCAYRPSLPLGHGKGPYGFCLCDPSKYSLPPPKGHSNPFYDFLEEICSLDIMVQKRLFCPSIDSLLISYKLSWSWSAGYTFNRPRLLRAICISTKPWTFFYKPIGVPSTYSKSH